jgi:hypothetical protein
VRLRSALDGSVHVAAPPLGLEGALVLPVSGVPIDHRPVVPAHLCVACRSSFPELLTFVT